MKDIVLRTGVCVTFLRELTTKEFKRRYSAYLKKVGEGAVDFLKDNEHVFVAELSDGGFFCIRL